MYSANTRERFAAVTVALGITFGIVSAMSNYAYSAPDLDMASQIIRAAAPKACS